MRTVMAKHVNFGSFMVGVAAMTVGMLAGGATGDLFIGLLPLLFYDSGLVLLIPMSFGAAVGFTVWIGISKPIILQTWRDIYRPEVCLG